MENVTTCTSSLLSEGWWGKSRKSIVNSTSEKQNQLPTLWCVSNNSEIQLEYLMEHVLTVLLIFNSKTIVHLLSFIDLNWCVFKIVSLFCYAMCFIGSIIIVLFNWLSWYVMRRSHVIKCSTEWRCVEEYGRDQQNQQILNCIFIFKYSSRRV